MHVSKGKKHQQQTNETRRLTYVPNYPRELDVDHQVPRVQELLLLFAREAIHTRQFDINILVSDSDGLPDLGCGESVEEVQDPPRSSATLSLNGAESSVSRCRSMHAQAESYSRSNAAVAICCSDAT